jgi:diguanylate cyclase (GGDEF)-like protein/PAS domain S-box-containing protein
MQINVPLHPADLLDSLNEIVFQTDPHGNWTYLNQAWTRVTGFSVRDTLGNNFLEYVHPDERQRTIELFTAVVSGGATYCHHESRYRTASGRFCWLELRASVRYDESGQMLGNAGTMFDITARREAQELLDEQTAILELIAQDAPLPHILGSLAGLLARYSGAPASVATSATASGLISARKGRARGRADHTAAVQDLNAAWMLVHASPDGTVEHTLSPTLDQLSAPNRDAGAPHLSQLEHPIRSNLTHSDLGWFVLSQDQSLAVDTRLQQVIERCIRLACIAITRAHTEDKIRRQALEDPLTGLPNRALLWDRFEQELAGARRSGLLLGVVLFDLDHFKDINDKFGHVVGDRALRAVAAQIGSSIRASDTLARLGGDEFALLVPGLRDVEEAEQITRKALARIEDELRVDDVLLKLNASVGIAVHPTHGSDPTSLLRRADVAMYRAKRFGGRIAVYDPVRDQEELESLTFIAELQHAIDADELVLHYQPKINLRTGDTVGAECLVRWQHPSRGIIPPNKFIPLAESTGLVKPLTLWVVRQALEDSRSWQAQGLEIPVAVNLSAPLLHDAELPYAIDHALRASNAPERQLELEITESAVMQDPEGAMKTISLLHSTGISFSLDDFGTGYSSLAYLKNLQVQAIKIDRSFVRDMVTDQRDASIVRAAIELGHNFRMHIVAEGVESQPIRELLTSLDCDHAQGFHLARPMPSAVFLGWHGERENRNHRSAPQ